MSPLPAGAENINAPDAFVWFVAVFIGVIIALLWLAAYGPQIEAWWRGRP